MLFGMEKIRREQENDKVSEWNNNNNECGISAGAKMKHGKII